MKERLKLLRSFKNVVESPSRTTSTHRQIDDHFDSLVCQKRSQMMELSRFAVDVVECPLNCFNLRKEMELEALNHQRFLEK